MFPRALKNKSLNHFINGQSALSANRQKQRSKVTK